MSDRRLTEQGSVHFPSARVGFTWCGVPLDIAPDVGITDGAQADCNGVLFATNMPVVTCSGCASGEMVEAESSLTPSKVALAKVLAAWEEWPGDRRENSIEADSLRDIGELMKARGFALWTGIECNVSDKGRALLDRAREAGVL